MSEENLEKLFDNDWTTPRIMDAAKLKKQLDEIQEALNEKTLWQKYQELEQKYKSLETAKNWACDNLKIALRDNDNYLMALEKIKNILNETLETHRITVALARIRDIINEVFKYGKA